MVNVFSQATVYRCYCLIVILVYSVVYSTDDHQRHQRGAISFFFIFRRHRFQIAHDFQIYVFAYVEYNVYKSICTVYTKHQRVFSFSVRISFPLLIHISLIIHNSIFITMASSDNINNNALSGKEGVCLIEVTSVEFVHQQPWQRCCQVKVMGTGFVIADQKILTNAHVVASGIDIRVRLHGSSKRFPAKIAVYAPDVDLALLEIQPEFVSEFFAGGSHLALEFADTLPALQERVSVVGFPTGGKTICITEGVVSRIDSLVISSPSDSLLVIQIDAVINPGNSGGPAFSSDGNKVTGVAFANRDNIGYVIPADIVRAFLGRCDRHGVYTLSPSVPYRWHSLENRSLRLAHNVPDNVHGILLTDVSPTISPCLQKGDVLTKIDHSEVHDDGQVKLRGDELIQHRYILRGKHEAEQTVFFVYRNGKHIKSAPCVLTHIQKIFLRWPEVDHQADYLILGSLVLLPMSDKLMKSAKAGTRLKSLFHTWDDRWPGDWEGKEGLVVLTNILAHELSFSYERVWRCVTA
jgi:S1-C subfamily serine protease